MPANANIFLIFVLIILVNLTYDDLVVLLEEELDLEELELTLVVTGTTSFTILPGITVCVVTF